MLKERHEILRNSLMFFDLCVVAGAFLLSYLLRNFISDFQGIGDYPWFLPLLLAIWCYLLYRFGMYASFRIKDISDLIYIVFKSAFFGLLIFSGLIYFLKIAHISRSFIALVFILAAVLLCVEKAAMLIIFRFFRRKGYNYRNILIVGSSKRAEKFIQRVINNAEWGLRIIGIVDEEAAKTSGDLQGINIIGSFNDLARIIHNNVVDEVVFVVPHSLLEKIKDMVSLCEIEGIRVSIAMDLFDLSLAKAKQTDLDGFPLLTFETTSDKAWHLFIKRIFDMALSVIGLLLIMPVFVIVAVLIKLTSSGPVFFKQARSGLNGRKFNLYKFRTMVSDAEQKLEELRAYNEMQGPVFKMKNDPRVTCVGKFLRMLSIDELPQLWNVFEGDMSLVGPRPPIPSEVEKYDNWQRRRLSMRPGITCLWQVSGRNKITDFNEWMKLDLKYIDNWSLWLDCNIFVKTIPVVLFGIGAK